MASKAALLILGVLLAWAGPTARADFAATAETADPVRYEQKLGATLPLDAPVVDELGQAHPLGDFFGKKPVVLAFAYYECPNLCTLVLNGLASAIDSSKLRLGEDYDAVVLSIDPKERPPLALAKKRSYLARLGRSATGHEASAPWHFLTAAEPVIRQLTEAAGFHYHYDELARQFAHPSGIVFATPEGKISKYLLGMRFDPAAFTAALERAGRSRIGTVVDDLLLLCFHFDPAASAHGAQVMAGIRVLGIVGALTLAATLFILFRREGTA